MNLQRSQQGFLIAIALFVFAYSPIALAKEALRIGWVHSMGNAPVLIADRKGYFKEEGIEVSLQSFKSGPLAKRALEAGDLDIVYIGIPPILKAYSNGLDIKIIAKVNYGQAALLVPETSSVKNISDLKGLRIAGIRRGSGMDVLLRGFVLQNMGSLKVGDDINIIHMPAKMMIGAMDNKVVDAIFTWEPYVTLALIHGDARILLDMNKVVPHYPWYVIASRRSVLRHRSDDVDAVLRAHIKAVNYLNSSENAGSAIIAEEFRIKAISNAQEEVQSLSPEKIVTMAKERTGWQYELTDSDIIFMQNLMDISVELGLFKKPLNVKNIIDTSHIKSVMNPR